MLATFRLFFWVQKLNDDHAMWSTLNKKVISSQSKWRPWLVFDSKPTNWVVFCVVAIGLRDYRRKGCIALLKAKSSVYFFQNVLPAYLHFNIPNSELYERLNQSIAVSELNPLTFGLSVGCGLTFSLCVWSQPPNHNTLIWKILSSLQDIANWGNNCQTIFGCWTLLDFSANLMAQPVYLILQSIVS